MNISLTEGVAVFKLTLSAEGFPLFSLPWLLPDCRAFRYTAGPALRRSFFLSPHVMVR